MFLVHLNYTRGALLPVALLMIFVLSKKCISIHINTACNNWCLVLVPPDISDSLMRVEYCQLWGIKYNDNITYITGLHPQTKVVGSTTSDIPTPVPEPIPERIGGDNNEPEEG